MTPPGHPRARSLRERGHTIRFIACQLGLEFESVAVFIEVMERRKDARRDVQMQGTTDRIGPSSRLSRPWGQDRSR
jgi:hypothetical protein